MGAAATVPGKGRAFKRGREDTEVSSDTQPCSPRCTSSKKAARVPSYNDFTASLQKGVMWCSTKLGSFAFETISPPLDVASCDGAVRSHAMGPAALSLMEADEQLLTVMVCRHELGARPQSAETLLPGLALSVASALIPNNAAKSALLFGAAVNTVFQTCRKGVAWHHFVILEGLKTTYRIELLHAGIRVLRISSAKARTKDELLRHRRELCTMKTSGRESTEADVLEERFVAHVTLDPAVKWLRYIIEQEYDLFQWNCQHVAHELSAVYAPYGDCVVTI